MDERRTNARFIVGESGMATVLNRLDESEKSMAPANDQGGYRPGPDEEFMNPKQAAYFRNKLQAWKDGILKESRDTLNQLQNDSLREPDVTDRASSETDWSIELRTRDRQR